MRWYSHSVLSVSLWRAISVATAAASRAGSRAALTAASGARRLVLLLHVACEVQSIERELAREEAPHRGLALGQRRHARGRLGGGHERRERRGQRALHVIGQRGRARLELRVTAQQVQAHALGRGRVGEDPQPPEEQPHLIERPRRPGEQRAQLVALGHRAPRGPRGVAHLAGRGQLEQPDPLLAAAEVLARARRGQRGAPAADRATGRVLRHLTDPAPRRGEPPLRGAQELREVQARGRLVEQLAELREQRRAGRVRVLGDLRAQLGDRGLRLQPRELVRLRAVHLAGGLAREQVLRDERDPDDHEQRQHERERRDPASCRHGLQPTIGLR
jgi:hypothetical protein